MRLSALVATAWLLAAVSPLEAATRPSNVPTPLPTPYRTILDTYCVSCHNQTLRTAGLTLDAVSARNVGDDAAVWERVIRKLRLETMPPPGRPRPDRATYRELASWLETEMDRAAAVHPNPGRSETFHRLNRFEYQNSVRDLLALDVDVTALLPSDNTYDQGFDNNAEQLSVSPALLERYLAAGRKISRLAVGIAPASPQVDTYKVHLNVIQDDRLSEDLPFGSLGGIAVRHYFPVDGEYRVKIKLQANYNDYIRGMGRPHDLDVRVDGALVKRFTVGGAAKGMAAPGGYGGNIMMDREWEDYMHHADDGLEVSFPAKAGARVVAVTFVRRLAQVEGVLHPRQTSYALAVDQRYFGNASVQHVSIGGPYRAGGPGDTPSRRRIFLCRPAGSAESTIASAALADDQACAKTILTRLARRAYRRPVNDQDVQALLAFYKTGRSQGGFDDGIQFALERLLVDPNFLFRVERDPAKVAAGGVYSVTDLELASRLATFLWGSIPDEELVDLAARGKLTQRSVLEQQVRRLLGDGRSKRALVNDFAMQWLQLRRLRGLLPDPDVFPDFDENLRDAFQRETELFIDSTIREDRSIVELLSANYTFVNERLARHYGIPNIYGNHFRRVAFKNDDTRGGLLGQGSILASTSYPNRTSPVLRGKWLLSTVVGADPPAPPPNVPALPERGDGGKRVSVRERLEQHRKNPVCATCHAPMDPLGFALENFDAIGSWRISGEGGTIDASAEMPNGDRINGPTGLRGLLVGRREQFAATVTEKLLAYALGRGLEPYDRPAVRQILRDAAAADYRWSSIVLGVVNSTPFRMRMKNREN